MIALHEKIDVSRPLVEAFDYVADFRNTEQWDSTVLSAQKLSAGPVGTGTRFDVICRLPAGSVTLLYTIIRYEPGKVVSLLGKNRFFEVADEIHFNETADGTHIDYRATFTFMAPLEAIANRFQQGLEQMGFESLQGLQQALEDSFPVPESTPADRCAERLVLPAIRDFTRIGFTKAKKHWLPMSRWMGEQHVVITGASAGLGLAAAHSLAARGAELTLIIRNERKALSLKQDIRRASGNSKIHIEIADLSLLADVEKLVRRLLRLGKPIDALINNAGALFNPREVTVEGLEKSFALLLLCPYRLTVGLKPLLVGAGAARVINVVSGGMYSQRLNLEQLEAAAAGYSGSVAYARSKRALMIVTEHWAQAWASENIVVNAMHPGWAKTPGVKASLPAFHTIARPLLRSPEQGADTIVWLTTATEAAKVSGKLFLDRKPRSTHLIRATKDTEAERSALIDILENYPPATAMRASPAVVQ